MTIGSVFFLLCAIACLAGALVTVSARNPVHSVLGLLLTIIGIAGMYLKLHAQFLAAIQLIVYAGAVVVLFVFVLMLLGADALDAASVQRSTIARWAGGSGLVAVIGLVTFRAVQVYSPATNGHLPPLPEEFGSVKSIGEPLFSQALVPFELSTALLIVAVIGAIAVARSGHKKRPTSGGPASSPHGYFGGPVRPRDEAAPSLKEPMP
jgi:NADH-quinone oxidoreductase subunit J